MRSWLLTGATGTLGRELLWDLVAAGDDVTCIVRGTSYSEAVERINALIEQRPNNAMPAEERARITIVCGDLTEPLLGLDQASYDKLALRVNGIIHGAANVNFNQRIDEARRINVDGTHNVLKFASHAQSFGGLERMEHISTAYVAGKRPGPILETELESGQDFNNSYEQTKCEAEMLVRKHCGELPITVLRPSIVVGDSKSGYTSSFKVLYLPLKILAAGYVWVVPAARNGRVDLVPVDYVVAAMREIRKNEESIGKTIHITAGEQGATIGDIADSAANFFDVRVPWMLPRWLFDYTMRPLLLLTAGSRGSKLGSARVFIPYLCHQAAFDTSERDRFVDKNAVSVPDVQSYFEQLLRYCIETDWGRRLKGSKDT